MPARDHGRAVLDRGRDVTLGLRDLRIGDQRAHHDAVIARVTDGKLARVLRRALHDLGFALVRHEDARRERAPLALVRHEYTQAHVPRVLRRLRQVDRRRLAAELEVHLLHRRCCLRHDLAPDLRRSGERDHVDRRMRRDQLPALDGLVDHDVEHSGWEPGRVGSLAEEHRRQRREWARPQDE